MKRLRLGVYSDTAHGDAVVDGRRVPGTVKGDYPFLVFVTEVGRHFANAVVLGRYEPRTGDFVALPPGLELAPLPSYPSLASPRAVVGSLAGTLRSFWRAVGAVDVVWCFGPHPFALALAVVGRLRRRRVVFGVRQDPIRYFAARGHDSRPWHMPAVRAIAGLFRLLARGGRVTAVGAELVAAYPRSQAYDLKISLTRESEIEPHVRPPRGERSELRLLTVGRVAPEKSPAVLLEAIARLKAEGRDVRLTWVGTGELLDESVARARSLGLANEVVFAGHVDFGRPLLDAYRSADLFVHVAVTEGVPQVLFEAFAAGLPVVATDVGGVRAATGDGGAALLVPPRDVEALAAAIGQLADDEERAARLAEQGLEIARDQSLERSAAAVAAFLAAD